MRCTLYQLARGNRGSLRYSRAVVDELRQFLWPTNAILLESKLVLLRMLNPTGEKLSLCEEALSVLDVLDPGLSVQRGVVLFERHSAAVAAANAEFEAAPSAAAAAALAGRLREALGDVDEAERCLEMEEDGEEEEEQDGSQVTVDVRCLEKKLIMTFMVFAKFCSSCLRRQNLTNLQIYVV